MSAKAELRRLVNSLSEGDAQLWLLAMRDRDRVAWALATAPFDDEPETPEEAAAVAEAREQLARGEVISDEELWRRLGHGPLRR